MKTRVKYFGLAVGPKPGNMSQNGQKPTSLTMSLRKTLQTPTKKNFLSAE